jgi:threonine synthase
MAKAFDELEALGWIGPKRPKIIVVQAEGCAPLVRAFQSGADHAEPWKDASTIAAGIRVPSAIGDYLVLKAIRESKGTAIAVSDAAIQRAQREMAEQVGLYSGPEGAATWAALSQLLHEGFLTGAEDIVLFSTSLGLKYP